MDKFEYSDESFIWAKGNRFQDALGKLDVLLRRKWEDAQDRGYFRYRLDKLETKIIPGKLGFVAQLNAKRAQERRKPQDIQRISQPYCPDDFNFTKVKEEELLFELAPSWEKNDVKNPVIINVSPLEYCNSLLVPNVNGRLPQLLTKHGLQLAIELVLLSGTRNFKVGFNSLCAYASVNHHHYHLYYLNHRLPAETLPVEHLSGNCYVSTEGWPAEGFGFQLLGKNVAQLVDDVYKLSEYLVESEISHNVMITRGSSFSGDKDTLRVFLWARKSSYGAKDDFAFNIACCELSGHLPLKTQESYDEMDENAVSKILYDACHEVHHRVRPHVAQIFSERNDL